MKAWILIKLKLDGIENIKNLNLTEVVIWLFLVLIIN